MGYNIIVPVMPNHKPPAIPAYVIAFKEDRAGRRRIKASFGKLGLTPRFVDAIRGSSIDAATKRAFLNPARQYRASHFLQDNALGCALCHYQAWQDFLARGEDWAFIFEDDAIANPSQVKHIAGRMHGLIKLAPMLDIVFLDICRKHLPRIHLAQLDKGCRLCVVKHNDFGGHAYFITRPASQALYAHPGKHIYEVDFHMHHWWRHDRQILYTSPNLFMNSGRESTIGYNAARGWANDNWHHQLARRLYRLKESVHKRLMFRFYISPIKKRLAAAGLKMCDDYD